MSKMNYWRSTKETGGLQRVFDLTPRQSRPRKKFHKKSGMSARRVKLIR